MPHHERRKELIPWIDPEQPVSPSDHFNTAR